MSGMAEFVAELEAEQSDLEALLGTLSDERWRTPTPAAGWDVRDQVSHLADTEEIAYDTMTGGRRSLNEEARLFSSPEAFTESGCEKGRHMAPRDVLAWWTGGAARTRAWMLEKDPKDRIPWGLGMSARAFVAARLMETWAHGLDVREAVAAPVPFGPRHRNVAWLVYSALPYGFRIVGREQPPGELRVELEAGGESWTFGPEDAESRITGQALEFCRVGVQRMRRADATSLNAEGALADAFLDVARAFL
jgi:uncharacterized protein (TIGR03084 family)